MKKVAIINSQAVTEVDLLLKRFENCLLTLNKTLEQLNHPSKNKAPDYINIMTACKKYRTCGENIHVK